MSSDLERAWRDAWPDALAAWGTHLRLRAPVWHGRDDVPPSVASFAWFSTTDVEVHIDLDGVRSLGLEGLATEVLAHEVGHHVLAPGDLGTSARMLARARIGLVDLVDHAPLVSNLWSDLLINDRLQRRAGLRMDDVWRRIGPPRRDDVVMHLVMRGYELLWALPSGTLVHAGHAPEREAQLLHRAVRAYADDPVGGVAGFAALVRGLLGDRQTDWTRARTVVCGQDESGASGLPAGVATDPRLGEPAVHPSLDPRVVGGLAAEQVEDPDGAGSGSGAGPTTLAGEHGIEPAEYAALLRRLGIETDAERAAADWYRQHAAAHLVPFPTRAAPRAPEPLVGGFEDWDPGHDLGDIDWPGSLTRGPVPIPGFTLVRRQRLDDDETEMVRTPVDLDLYLDSSGSIPDPRRSRSPLALAGAILALSALRTGARVQATTWSGPDQVAGTDGFTESADDVLRAVVAYFGGGTAFPLERLVATHAADRRDTTRRCHVAVVSDEGVHTMFARSGAAEALEHAGGGGSLVLRLPESQEARVRDVAGAYAVHRVQTWEDLVVFARDFAARTWALDRQAAR